MNNFTIGFRNQNQVVLFEKELKGQISDGMWENSSPRRHYELPCLAVAYVAKTEAEVGRNFHARTYNFVNSELLDVVADRMINLVKLSQAFPHIALEDIFDIDTNARDTVESWNRYASTVKYYHDKIVKVCQLVGQTDNVCEVMSTEELISKLEAGLNSVTYTLKDLRKDLNEMKACWKIVR